MALPKEIEEQRRLGISATDAAPVCGLSPWKSPADVWIEKKRPELIPEKKPKAAFEWGLRLEDVIAEKYADMTGLKLEKAGLVRSTETSWMTCSPDRLISGRKKGVELKTASAMAAWEWGKDGTDQVPQQYLLQVAHSMMTTRYDQWDLAVLIGGVDFRIYHLFRDADLMAMVFETEEEFYKRFILGNEVPSFDWGKNVEALIHSKWPKHTDKSTLNVDENGDPILRRALMNLSECKIALKRANRDQAPLIATIQSYMGTHDRLAWDGQAIKISWRNTKESTSTDWRAVALEAMAAANLTAEQLDPLIKKHTQQKGGKRVFRMTGKFGSDDDGE